MTSDSLKKFNRIVAILIILQSKKVVKAQDLAHRFEVSLRTIYRDIQTLEQAGVPIVGETGMGYSLVEGYKLPPIAFGIEEAMSLITAEKLVQQFTDKSIGFHYESAMNKIKAVLRTKDKQTIEGIENQIKIRPRQNLHPKIISNSLEIVLKSIAEQKQITLTYKSLEETVTERIIEPVGLFYQEHFWYILGYCLLRKDYRQFRTDRILKMSNTNTDFVQQHGDLATIKLPNLHTEIIKVRILVEKQVAKFIVNSKHNYGFVAETETPDGVEMTFMTTEIKEGFPRWLLMFADYIKILEPAVLQTNMQRILKQIQQYHNIAP